MSEIPEKYYTLKSPGLVKRLDDAMAALAQQGLSHKGLHQSVLRLKEILIEDMVALEKQLQRARIVSWLLQALLIGVIGYILASIFVSDPAIFSRLKTTIDKTGFLETSMNIVVGFIVSSLSILLWNKKRSQQRVKKITDQIHELAHRFHMYQLGKTETQIIPPDESINVASEEYRQKLRVYLDNIQLGIALCAKTVVIIYHFSDDDEITAAARHIETSCEHMVAEMDRRWQHQLSTGNDSR